MRQNSVQISGIICKPEIHQFENNAVCHFNLAISRYEKKGEEAVFHTAYLPVEVWKAKSEDFDQFTKGALVEISGWLKAETYTDKEGQTHSRLIIATSSCSFIDKSSTEGGD